jgi:hypothetical protein
MTEDSSNATSPPQDEPGTTEETSPDSASNDAVAASAKLHQAVLKAAQDAEDAVVRSLTSEGLVHRLVHRTGE